MGLGACIVFSYWCLFVTKESLKLMLLLTPTLYQSCSCDSTLSLCLVSHADTCRHSQHGICSEGDVKQCNRQCICNASWPGTGCSC